MIRFLPYHRNNMLFMTWHGTFRVNIRFKMKNQGFSLPAEVYQKITKTNQKPKQWLSLKFKIICCVQLAHIVSDSAVITSGHIPTAPCLQENRRCITQTLSYSTYWLFPDTHTSVPGGQCQLRSLPCFLFYIQLIYNSTMTRLYCSQKTKNLMKEKSQESQVTQRLHFLQHFHMGTLKNYSAYYRWIQ